MPDNLIYPDPYQRQATVIASAKDIIELSPWAVQTIAYELVVQHLLNNDAKADGHKFSCKYDPDPLKTEIAVGMAYHYDDKTMQKRPAVYIYREEATYAYPTINRDINIDEKTGDATKFAMVSMPIGVVCLATTIGLVESLASFVSRPFVQFQSQITRDFCLRRFRLVNISKAQPYKGAKDTYIIVVSVQSVFDDGVIIHRDALPIKTVSVRLFDALTFGNPQIS